MIYKKIQDWEEGEGEGRERGGRGRGRGRGKGKGEARGRKGKGMEGSIKRYEDEQGESGRTCPSG